MQKGKVTGLFFRCMNKAATPFKIIAPLLLVLLLFAAQITPLYAQLSPARDLTGMWQSSASGMYYDMDPSDSSTRMNVITAKFAMDITQKGSQITIILYLNPISWVTDNAYWQEYQMSGVPPVGGGSIEFTGTVISSSFTADEQGSQLTQEHLVGTFTTDIITATLSGTSETTSLNGIVVTRTSSPTSAPTRSPTSTPSTTTQPTFNRYSGNVALNKGSAWFTNTGANMPLSSGQMGSGTTVLTSNDSIVGFTYPMQDGTVYLSGNTAAGWVALTSKPAPDNQIAYLMYPSNVALPPIWGQDAKDMLISIPLEAAIAVALFGETVPLATAVGIVVEGGVFLIQYGTAYIQERNSHLVQVPQGLLVGENTEYIVDVSNAATTVQVLEGPVVFVDTVTNNTIIVDTNQMLTLPTGVQSGFNKQDLQSDISAFNAGSVNQWWTQTTPNASNGLANFPSQPLILMVVVLAIVIAIAAGFAATRRRTQLQHKSSTQTALSLYPGHL
jgi:hypothetical protein